jgi:uncharacterized repeat protein (TIGR02543 family)
MASNTSRAATPGSSSGDTAEWDDQTSQLEEALVRDGVARGRAARLLIVEDDSQTLAIMVDALTHGGHDTTTTRRIGDARRTLQQSGDVACDIGAFESNLEAPAPPEEFTLTVSIAGEGSGSVARDPDEATYEDGTEVTLTATPDTGSVFVTWSGDCSGTNPVTDVTMTGDRNCTATFDEEPTADDSGFTAASPGTQQTGAAFALELTDARDLDGVLLDAPAGVTVSSDHDGLLFDDDVTFDAGAATVPGIVLTSANTHELTIEVAGVTDAETVVVTASAPPPPPDPGPIDTPDVPAQAPPDGEPVLENADEAPTSSENETIVSSEGAQGTATVEAPPAALPEGSTLSVAAVANLDEVADTSPPPSGAELVLGFVAQVRDADGEPFVDDFAEPLTMQFTLNPGVLPEGTPEGEIAVAFWDGEGWNEVDAVVTLEPDGSYSVVATVEHFTLFGVLHQPGRGAFTIPPRDGVTLTIWGGGGYALLDAALAEGSDWAWVDSEPVGYLVGGPAFVNAAFLEAFPRGLPADTAVVTAR